MKLGELFVELGVDSGGAMGTLSNFAFKFNNVAEMAKKMQKSFENFGGAKEMATFSQTILDLAKNLNLTTNNIQGLRRAATRSGTDFGTMTSKLAEFEKRRINAITGNDRSFFQEYAKYGLDVKQLYGSQNPLQTMRALVNSLQKIRSDRDRQSFASAAGFSVREMEAWKDYFKNQYQYDNDALNLTQKQLEQNADLNTSLNELSIKLEDAGNKIQQNLMPTLNKIIDVVGKVVDHFNKDEARDFVEKYPLLSILHPMAAMEKLMEHGQGIVDELGLNNLSPVEEAGIALGLNAIPVVGSTLGAGMMTLATTDAITSAVLNATEGKTKQNPLFNKTLSTLSGYADTKKLGLKGNINAINSDPRILAQNIGKLKFLDEYLAKQGYTVEYTSMMGGAHKGGSRSHSSGNKVDFQLFKNGKPVKLRENEAKYLESLGFWGSGTGALGYEEARKNQNYGHYDSYIGSTALENSLSGGVVYNNNKHVTINTTSENIPTVLKTESELDREINMWGEY